VDEFPLPPLSCRLVEATPRAAVFEVVSQFEQGKAGAEGNTHPEAGRVFASTAPDILETISRIGWQVGDTLIVETDSKGQIQSVKAPAS